MKVTTNDDLLTVDNAVYKNAKGWGNNIINLACSGTTTVFLVDPLWCPALKRGTVYHLHQISNMSNLEDNFFGKLYDKIGEITAE